jgi:TolB-like protein/Tfp pilus assembly protein PilF
MPMAPDITDGEHEQGERRRLAPGTRLGPYEIAAAIGAGGMGEVYRAHDVRLGRDVAIKVLPAHLAGNRDALDRFVREARAVAALSHPNILAIFDVGTEHDIAYTVTELLEGESLRTRLAREPMRWQDAVDIVIAVAEALTMAHAKGLIHRDLKPDNIFLTSDHRVKLLDFGIARWTGDLLDHDSTTRAALTGSGTIIGTLAYMSPEQARGENADAPSDIFSLGCVLHEALTGKRAFYRPTAAETLAAILKERPALPSAFDPLVPYDVDRVVARCLEKHPHDRFQDMTQLVAALRGLRDKTGTATQVVHEPVMSDRLDSIAVLPFVDESGIAELEYLADGIAESLINSLSQLEHMRVVARSTAFQYKGRQVDVDAVGSALNVRALLMGRVVQRGELINVQCELFDVRKRSQVWGEQYTRKPADVFVVQEQIAHEISKKLKLKLSREQKRRLTRRYTENTEAYQLYLRGRFYWNKRTPQSMKKAIEHFQLALEQDPAYVLAYSGLADCFVVLGSYGALSPKDGFERTKMAAQRALEIDPSLAEAYTSLAFVNAFYDWSWKDAEKHFRRANKLSPSYATAHQWFSFMLSAIGRTDEALSVAHKALDLDPLSLPINAQLSWALYIARQYGAAIQQGQKALEIDQNFGLTHYWLGHSQLQTRQHEDAVNSFMTSYKIAGTPQSLAGVGYAQAAAGRPDEARKVITQLEEWRSTRFIDPFTTAFVYLGLGDVEQTLTWLERCVEERSWWLAWLKTEPVFDAIRDHPRFRLLLSLVGLV